MAYYFMLGVVPLPITPGALTIKTPSMNKTINLVNEGEINIPKDRGLREISFEFLLPQVQKYPFANYQLGSYTASVMIPILNLWKQTKLPFPFIVVRTSPKGKILYFTSIKCLIEDYTYEEDAEEYGLDVMCSINLKEYKDYGTKSISLKEFKNSDGSTVQTASQSTTRSATDKTIPSSTKAQAGDTLPNVAKKTTGSFDYVEQIATENNVVSPPSGIEASTINNAAVDTLPKVAEKPLPTEVAPLGGGNPVNAQNGFSWYNYDRYGNGFITSPLQPIKEGATIKTGADGLKALEGLKFDEASGVWKK